MPKFNIRDNRTIRTNTGPLTAGHTWQAAMGDPVDPPTINHEGGLGYTRDVKSDLYLMATTSLDLTGDAYYETGNARINRYRALIRQAAIADPDWTYRFLTWLRGPGNIRTAALVGGIEAGRAMTEAGLPGGRHMVSTVLRRPDEPGEAIAYHYAVHGRKLPMAVKKGVADAAVRLYTEHAVLKYDTASHGVRFADVLALTHPTPSGWLPEISEADAPVDADEMAAYLETVGERREAKLAELTRRQGDLFAHIINRRYGRDDVPASLRMLIAHAALRARWTNTVGPGLINEVNADMLTAAGMNWEDVLSTLGSKVDKAALWRALIPSMGFMARLRNLRNFDQAGLSDADVEPVRAMLTDPWQVAKSRQLPLRFLSAHRATSDSLRWGHPLSQALDASIVNIPALAGRTLILIDVSTSMNDNMSDRSGLKRWDAAVAFGLAQARRCEHVDVVAYSGPAYWGQTGVVTKRFPMRAGSALLADIDRWNRDGYFLGGGTNTVGALREHFNGHNRVVLLTDEQDGGFDNTNVGATIPERVPLHTFNLAGYQTSHTPTSPYRTVIGGLTDAMFPLIPLIESGASGVWPWDNNPDITGLPNYTQTLDVTARETASVAGERSTIPEGSQGGRWHVTTTDGWTGNTTGPA
jgi:hypothetical protein